MGFGKSVGASIFEARYRQNLRGFQNLEGLDVDNITMQKLPALVPDQFFHIYSRGINRENIFIEPRNYRYFIELYAKYIEPVAQTFAYCLLKNHFHLLVRIKSEQDLRASQDLRGFGNLEGLNKPLDPTQQFSNFLNAYAKAINKTYHRTGSLFQGRFGRIPVTTDGYLITLVHYIHFNPQRHGLISDFREWEYSSYHSICSNKPTLLQREELLEWFNGIPSFLDVHQQRPNEKNIAPLIVDDID